jgi:hypothetical protein
MDLSNMLDNMLRGQNLCVEKGAQVEFKRQI